MNGFVNKSPEEKRIFIQQGALRSNLVETIIEKDFWVCWLLRKLFLLPGISEHLIFKGGTSLSKAYNLIKRFSEDIDISIDRALLGFTGNMDPMAAQSRTARDRRLEDLQAACINAIKNQLVPALTKAIAKDINRGGEVEIDKEDPLAVLFYFPSALQKGAFSYITPYVKLEFGARADPWPQEERTIRSYLSEQFPEQISEDDNPLIRILGVERTFWEKVTILHAEHYRPSTKALPNRLSRHYYDLHVLLTNPVGEKAARDLALLERVVKHKQVFFRSSWAHYEEAKPGTLKILPTDSQRDLLKIDYDNMREMFFTDPPRFEEILGSLKKLEDGINKRA